MSILVRCQNNVLLWALSEQPLSCFPSLFQYKGPLTNSTSPWDPLHEQHCHLCLFVHVFSLFTCRDLEESMMRGLFGYMQSCKKNFFISLFFIFIISLDIFYSFNPVKFRSGFPVVHQNPPDNNKWQSIRCLMPLFLHVILCCQVIFSRVMHT